MKAQNANPHSTGAGLESEWNVGTAGPRGVGVLLQMMLAGHRGKIPSEDKNIRMKMCLTPGVGVGSVNGSVDHKQYLLQEVALVIY